MDGIYPNWPYSVHGLVELLTEREKLLRKVQEGTRKDVQRAFRVFAEQVAPYFQSGKELVENVHEGHYEVLYNVS